MLTGLQWYIVALVLAGLLALFAVLAPRKRLLKGAALVCTALFLPISYLAANDLLSRPKPMEIEIARAQLDDAVVTASLMREDEAIYLWLQMPDVKEPRAYQLPWSEEMAVELHRAQREAEVQGTEVQMQLPDGETQDDDTPVFEAATPVPPPPKQTE